MSSLQWSSWTDRLQLADHFEARRPPVVHRAGAYPDCEEARLHDPLHALVVEREIIGSERERHRAALTRLDRDALEAAQLAYRSRHAGDVVTYVQLHHFVASARAGVFDVDLHRDRVGRCDARGAQPRSRVGK